jgi:hypothetical protein
VLSLEPEEDSKLEVCFFCLLFFFFWSRRPLREDFFFLSLGLLLVVDLEFLLLALALAFELEESPPSWGSVWRLVRVGGGMSGLRLEGRICRLSGNKPRHLLGLRLLHFATSWLRLARQMSFGV